MLTINLSDKSELHLPSGINEITSDFLKHCIEHYHIADDYALVGLCYQGTLNEFTNIVNAQKELRLLATPIFVASGKTDNDYIKSLQMGDVITIAGSDLSIGNHIVFSGNDIEISYVCNLLKKHNINLITDVRGRMPVVLLEFKLVPAHDIHGHWDSESDDKRTFWHIVPKTEQYN